jgi:hypothetical protein
MLSTAPQQSGVLKALNHGRPAEPIGPRRKRAKQFKIIESQKRIIFFCNLTAALLFPH